MLENLVKTYRMHLNAEAIKPSTFFCLRELMLELNEFKECFAKNLEELYENGCSAPSDDDQDFSDDNDPWQDGSIDNGIEKLVKTMEAAVKETIGRGVVHPGKIAICGHSFGCFMTSVLLVHAPYLFCCGVARSGAYNRTLTPFGYQEYKTLWETTSSYFDMSTILSADKLKKPILLVHGQEDGNAGTWPMQFIRFFESLRGNGVECRLVILPLEGHGYIARESVLHVLWEMDS
ncbi:hypothetical protein OROMI_007438 [Orobanche minor]